MAFARRAAISLAMAARNRTLAFFDASSSARVVQAQTRLEGGIVCCNRGLGLNQLRRASRHGAGIASRQPATSVAQAGPAEVIIPDAVDVALLRNTLPWRGRCFVIAAVLHCAARASTGRAARLCNHLLALGIFRCARTEGVGDPIDFVDVN
jgi:hypothetical protein